MKFYLAIVPVILCIMYTAAIFGSESTTLFNPSKGVYKDVWNVIEKFRGPYQETVHVKPYPPHVKQLLGRQNSLILAFGSGSFLTIGFPLAFTGLSSLLERIKRKSYLSSLASLASLAGAVASPFVGLILFAVIIDIITRSYTFIESPPQRLHISDDAETVCVQGTRNFVVGGPYRTEYRQLSNMKLKWRGYAIRLGATNTTLKRNGRIYDLEDGQVDIYRSEKHFKLKDKCASLETTEEITAFDVFQDGIVTAGKDGTRKWELRTTESIQKILETE